MMPQLYCGILQMGKTKAFAPTSQIRIQMKVTPVPSLKPHFLAAIPLPRPPIQSVFGLPFRVAIPTEACVSSSNKDEQNYN